MEKFKTIALCVVPYLVTAAMLYPLAAIIGASWDAFSWDRADRVFYFICVVVFGWALMLRLLEGDK